MSTNIKTAEEYLSGEHDEELRVLVAEATGYTQVSKNMDGVIMGNTPIGQFRGEIRFTSSLDACRELLADLTDVEMANFRRALAHIVIKDYPLERCCNELIGKEIDKFLRATARQICAAYLITKGILK